MVNNFIELFKSLESLELKFSEFYDSVSKSVQLKDKRLATMAAVLSSQERLHAKWYHELLSNDEIKERVTIQDDHIAVANKLLLDFKATIQATPIDSSGQLIASAIHFEQENAQLLIALKKEVSEEEGSEPLIELFDKLIAYENEHARVLMRYNK